MKQLVLVHPWYDEETNKFYRPHGFEKNRSYTEALDSLLQQDFQDLFLFEETSKMLRTARKVQAKSNAQIDFIRTRSGTSIPVETNWDEIAKEIKMYGNDAVFAGGYLGNHEGYEDMWGGCLGTAFNELTSRGVKGKLDFECCFISSQAYSQNV